MTELVGGALFVVGFQTRAAALVLAGFSIVSAILFHNYWAVTDAQMAYLQTIMFSKNLSIAGGFLILAGHGAGPIAVDILLAKRG